MPLTTSLELSMTTLRRSTFLIERIETSPQLRRTRINLMPALRATKIELHGRRINSREVRTRTDLERLTITQPKRLPKSSPAMTREKDQLKRGENQDRLGEINDNSSKKTSEIQSSHDERERGNGRLLKALASM